LPKSKTPYEEFCVRIVKNRLILAGGRSHFAPIFESGKKHITKKSLRKFLLSQFHDMPRQGDSKLSPQSLGFSRLDCHILVKMLHTQGVEDIKAEKDPAKRKYLKQNQGCLHITQLKQILSSTASSKSKNQLKATGSMKVN